MLPEQTNTIKNATAGAGSTNSTGAAKINQSTIINLRHSEIEVAEPPKEKRKRIISFQDKLVEAPYRRGRRVHGLQLPLHPQQIFGWIVLLIFGFSAYFVLIPAFRLDLQGPLYGLLTGLGLIHVVSHLTALLLDPADKELRRVHRNDRIVPEFDRTKHSHVIENGRCHLCNIRISGQRTKHCSVCNKCVGKFDHHCKWLNHCIGGRNYVSFLMCVVSAVVAALVILAAVISQLVLYHVDPSWLNLWWSTTSLTSPTYQNVTTIVAATITPDSLDTLPVNETVMELVPNNINITTNSNESIFLFNETVSSTVESIILNGSEEVTMEVNVATGEQIGFHDTIFLIFIGFLGVLAAITAGLLLHLCFFHIYISFLGVTTFEYIRNQRDNSIPSTQAATAATSGANPSDPKTDVYFCSTLSNPNDVMEHNSDERRPSSLHCCENSREYHQTAVKTYYMCTMLEEGSSTAPATSDESSSNDDKTKTFHCCSQFARQTIQFTEQCTFCRVKLRESSKDGSYLKTISKHRWKRKWTCCGSVPDSPDVPNDIISSISRNVHENGKLNGNTNQNRPKTSRPWPIQRFRQMLRMLSRYRRPRCRHISTPAKSFKNTIKQNQIRPINTSSSSSSFSTEGSSSLKSNDDDITTIPIETILPTTIIRNNGELTMPVLPPPTRRKIPPNPTDLEELAETLSQQQQQLRIPPVNYRRQRRKHFMRTRSPTLSPIHESGLSNPTSPQPCRHNATTSNCSPVIINKLCSGNGSQQSLNKSSSNGSFTESSD